VSAVRFRFGPFLLSPRQRALWRDGREVPLIPRYFDLLVLLLQKRHEAVHRSDIFATVWSDVVVSDGALTQAVRALRRALGDDPREPVYIRTVSRHGYRFVFAAAEEEPEDGLAPATPVSASQRPAEHPSSATFITVPAQPAWSAAATSEMGDPTPAHSPERALGATARGDGANSDGVEALLVQLCSLAVTDEERREAAERLHASGTAVVLERLGHGPGAAGARAMLRDTRWDVPGAGMVPLWGSPQGLRAAVALVALRARRAWRLAGGRWLSGVLGTALAGVVTGIVGGLGLWALPGAQAPPTAAAVLAGIGALAGAVGAAGVAGGLCATEAIARSARGPLLISAGALGGLLVGTVAHWLTRWTLQGLFGLTPGAFGGSLEGLLLGAACGFGYAWATADVRDGMAAPRGRARWVAAARVAACCAAAALVLGAAGRPMVGGLVNTIAQASRASHLALTPLARAVGEPDFGAVTAAMVGAIEGAAFGCGLTLGLTRRPRSRR
jgi:DNA-binding winged helix-turn-helix (wHTH) protein